MALKLRASYCLTKDLPIKFANFSPAVNVRDKRLTQGLCIEFCDTPDNVPPETLVDGKGRKYSFPVDIWSTGVVMYIFLYGLLPFSEEPYSKEFPYTMSRQTN